ncbi:MAG: hypothetical protein E5Y74_12900 [Mesorhizobium sp.]|nr:MAG: hypothetical protein E5Y74_12900 [Mesorhizobium sp.]
MTSGKALLDMTIPSVPDGQNTLDETIYNIAQSRVERDWRWDKVPVGADMCRQCNSEESFDRDGAETT